MFNAIKWIASAILSYILVGFLFQAYSFAAEPCKYADKRICDINSVLEAETHHNVTFKVDYTARVADYEWVVGAPDIVHLGDTTQLTDDELFFALAHEFGHSVMKHGRKFVESFGPESAKFETDNDLLAKYGKLAQEGEGQQALNHGQEYQADEFAAHIMAKRGLDVIKAVKGLLKPSASSVSHPSKAARIEKLRQIVS